ncbi:hypothetical protein [Nesterenkonia haasae]|uniref:hypothetical protein n=1 Tax=Nesterenkonia haasae TaxID=2587813 RepID=UPI0013919EB2|nr:hypothetical protein [Nesterenkonia haasae]NDK32451.1 hypothetical protein [Nesterenkonia haasae]
MVQTVVSSNDELRREKTDLLRGTELSETELLRRGEEWIPMSDTDWNIFYKVSDINWLIEHGNE